MDCIIPSHNIRVFSHAVTCLSRIGKELYIEFDALSGLTLRTLNDAKSAFATFSFDPHFFERCSAPVVSNSKITQQRDDNDNNSSTNRSSARKSSSRRTKKQRRRQQHESNNKKNRTSDDWDDTKYVCRVSLRTVHAILRQRKGIQCLRLRSTTGSSSTPNNYSQRQQSQSSFVSGTTHDDDPLLLQLCFEFRCETTAGHFMKITRRVGVQDCDTSVTAIAPTEEGSQIVTGPRVFSKMLDPLCRTAEVALTIDESQKTVRAISFHLSDATKSSNDAGVVSLVGSTVLKTETSMNCHEFEEYSWRDDRIIDDGGRDDDVPQDVNEKVTLVFGIKEIKAFLQFCTNAIIDDELRVVMFFEWGGRPIIFESEGDTYTSRLIMSTVDHKMLGDVAVSRRDTHNSSNNRATSVS